MFLENSYFIRGIIIGFLISIPVGPVAILCIRRALAHGFFSGFASGVGAALADGFYSIIAVFGLTFVSSILVRYQLWFKLFGGLFLMLLGYAVFSAPPVLTGAIKTKTSLLTDCISAFLVTIANPLTIFAFVAFFAGLGVGVDEAGYFFSGLLILGVMAGSALWWLGVTGIAGLLSSHFNPHSLQLLNKISGIGIMVFGFIALLTIFK